MKFLIVIIVGCLSVCWPCQANDWVCEQAQKIYQIAYPQYKAPWRFVTDASFASQEGSNFLFVVCEGKYDTPDWRHQVIVLSNPARNNLLGIYADFETNFKIDDTHLHGKYLNHAQAYWKVYFDTLDPTILAPHLRRSGKSISHYFKDRLLGLPLRIPKMIHLYYFSGAYKNEFAIFANENRGQPAKIFTGPVLKNNN